LFVQVPDVYAPPPATVAEAVIVGASLSMSMSFTDVLALLPALSTAVPLTAWFASLVVSVWSGPQDAMPDGASPHVNATVTSPLFQPAPFGAGEREPLIVGTVASRLIVTDCELVPPALVAEQVNVVALVSDVIVVVPQPVCDETVESGSVTVQLTVTSLVYQPLFPSVPVTLGVITGGVVSVGPATVSVNVTAGSAPVTSDDSGSTTTHRATNV
jgi:hypothetical protein